MTTRRGFLSLFGAISVAGIATVYGDRFDGIRKRLRDLEPGTRFMAEFFDDQTDEYHCVELYVGDPTNQYVPGVPVILLCPFEKADVGKSFMGTAIRGWWINVNANVLPLRDPERQRS